MNQRRPSNDSLDSQRHPVLESLFMDPKNSAHLLQLGVNEGVIDADELEAVLEPYFNRTRRFLDKSNKDSTDQSEIRADINKTFLLSKLINFEGEIEELKSILVPFCEANKITLEPRPGAVVYDNLKTNPKPDWISKDGIYALSIKANVITIYTKLRGQWVPFNK